MEQTLTLKFNDEQLENFENVLTEALMALPDDQEELATADPICYAGTLGDGIAAMAKQTNRGCQISEYMNCEV